VRHAGQLMQPPLPAVAADVRDERQLQQLGVPKPWGLGSTWIYPIYPLQLWITKLGSALFKNHLEGQEDGWIDLFRKTGGDNWQPLL